MNFFKKLYCRTFQVAFKILMPLLPYREPQKLDSILDIKTELKRNKLSSPLIVTDKGILSAGLVKPLEDDLKNAGLNVTIFDDTVPNPTITNIENGLKLYLKHNCDSLIAFGGGSAIDCAKGIGARVARPKKKVEDMKGLLKVGKKLPTLFAIPTTAGTGSETTLAAVITDSRTHHKYPINDFNLIPKYAVLDESLTVNLPPHITATTGMDALTHAVEAYIGKSTTKYTRDCALKACKIIFDNLEHVYDNPTDLKGREKMLNAAYLAGIAFTRSYVGYVHAIAHSLGGKYNTPHGLANAVILPIVLKEFGSSVYKKCKEIAVYCKLAKETDDAKLATEKLIKKIEKMNKHFDLPTHFDFIEENDIDELVSHAEKEGNPLYPVPILWDKKKFSEVYKKVKNG